MESVDEKEANRLEELEKLIEHTIFNEENYKTVKACIAQSIKGKREQKMLKEMFFKYLYDVYTEILSLIAFDYNRFKKNGEEARPNSQDEEDLRAQLEERDSFLWQVLTRLERLAMKPE